MDKEPEKQSSVQPQQQPKPQQVAALPAQTGSAGATRAAMPKSYVDAVQRASGHGPERGYWNPIGTSQLV